MAPKLYITGTTGFIGGDALVEIVNNHPDWEITCQVRNSDKGAKIASVYPHIRLVYGDLDSVDLIEEEASKADIVYHFANCDHEASAHAIAKGMARREGSTPGYWIHTSGSFILGQETFDKNCWGEQTEKVFNDWEGVEELITLPDGAPHRPVDKIVLNASATHPNIKTAIVCPPTIYGIGRGPDNQRSIQLNTTTEFFLKQKKATMVKEGRNSWNYIHVRDLARLYLLLGEAAVAGGSPATWNEEGYYLAEDGEYHWGDVLVEIAKLAHKQGLLPSDKVESLSLEEAAAIQWLPYPYYVRVGSNSRGTSIRAKKLLSWTPRENSIWKQLPEVVETEAKRMGLLKGHAEKVVEASK